MKLTQKGTRIALVLGLINFAILIVGASGLEGVALTDKQPNNTFSHVVAIFYAAHPWIAQAYFIFGGLFVAAFLTFGFHWFGKNFWWPPAKFVDENDSENKDTK